MQYSSLPLLESNFLSTANNGEYTFTKTSIPITGEDINLETVLCVPKDRAEYYYNVEHCKERILLHFTAGNIRSDLSTLTMDQHHVSVPFVIGRNGTIYQLFSSKYWSGSIGKGVGNTNTGNAQDKAAIAIEISNYGYLTEPDGNLETYYSRLKDANGNIGPVDTYCSLTEEQAYQKLNEPFRKESYYATFTDNQYDSLIILLRYLTAQYNIPKEFFSVQKRYETTEDVISFEGIVSHVNYRKDGKWDIGPAFDWERIIEGVSKEKYVPLNFNNELFQNEANGLNINVLSSEQELEALLPRPIDPSMENNDYEESIIYDNANHYH